MYRKNQKKGGVKVHTLYDIETSIPTFFHITEARVNDVKAMDSIPYEEDSFYIFDRGYNDFKRLHNIHGMGPISWPIYEMLQVASISLTDTTPLRDLFALPNYNIVNELDGSTEPTLF